jgi:hypothetical protein
MNLLDSSMTVISENEFNNKEDISKFNAGFTKALSWIN